MDVLSILELLKDASENLLFFSNKNYVWITFDNVISLNLVIKFCLGCYVVTLTLLVTAGGVLCLTNLILSWTQPAFTCLKLTIETVEQGVKYVQS